MGQVNFIIKDADEVLYDIGTVTVLTKPVQLWNLILKHLAQFTKGGNFIGMTPAPVIGGGNVINDFNCAGQGTLSQINVVSDVNISYFGSSCGVQCADSSKSPNVYEVFCQNTGKAKKQGWKNR